MKIAVVGTGIAGNVAAHKLAQDHDITVFEAGNYVGGHSNTIDVDTPAGRIALDTGFIVFNDRTYPNFIKLLDELGVESQTSSMSFSVQCRRSALEYNGSTLNALFAQRRNLLRPGFHRMIADILRFNREAMILLEDISPDLPLAEFLKARNYSREFVEKYLIPMGAAIWSAEPGLMEKMPAHFFVRFFHNHGLLTLKDRPVWKVIKGGSRSYVEKLVEGHRNRIRLRTPVRKITRTPAGAVIYTDENPPETFDYVFLACHSDQALQLLADPTPAEKEVLGSIPYQPNSAVLHTDQSLMPRRRLAWGAWNYLIPNDRAEGVAVTYHLNRLQNLQCAKQYFVTLNSDHRIRPECIIRRMTYDHPVFTAESVSAQRRQPEINGPRRTFFCGAYWRNGFHEDGVVSALNALYDFDEELTHEERYFQRAS